MVNIMMNDLKFRLVKEANDYADLFETGQCEVRIWRNIFHSKLIDLVVEEILSINDIESDVRDRIRGYFNE